jgi:hypothetical protein
VANENAAFAMLVGLAKRFGSQFFDDFDGLVALMSRSNVQIFRSGDFLGDGQTDGTDYFTPCACVRGNN